MLRGEAPGWAPCPRHRMPSLTGRSLPPRVSSTGKRSTTGSGASTWLMASSTSTPRYATRRIQRCSTLRTRVLTTSTPTWRATRSWPNGQLVDARVQRSRRPRLAQASVVTHRLDEERERHRSFVCSRSGQRGASRAGAPGRRRSPVRDTRGARPLGRRGLTAREV